MVVNNKNQILLNHHKKVNRWIQFGGHCDKEPNPKDVALREIMEETGFGDLKVLGQ